MTNQQKINELRKLLLQAEIAGMRAVQIVDRHANDKYYKRAQTAYRAAYDVWKRRDQALYAQLTQNNSLSDALTQ